MGKIELNEEAALAAQYINTTNRHIFLTGKAGTGKTTFLRYIVRNTFKNTVIAAPTGIAAINAGGVTLHSLLQLPFGAFIPENIPFQDQLSVRLNTPESLGRGNRFRAEKRILLNQMELLIIDEVSMLRADMLDCIDMQLRSVRRKAQIPFGGVQLLFIGDLMQLPPVVKDDEWAYLHKYYKSPFFFESHALKRAAPITIELTKIYRQNEQEFIDLLNRLRNNQQQPKDIEWLNSFYKSDFQAPGYIYLTTHNVKADALNKAQLEKLKGRSMVFEAEVDGDFPNNMYPIPEKMKLKKGAQVMFIKNDPSGDGQFFNGKIGKVKELGKNKLIVGFEDGEEVDVDKYEWQNIRYEINPENNQVEEVELGRFIHYPIKLAWAVTVHKSQGLTFEKAVIDVADSFAPGQLYVALSRLTSLDGLVLSSPIPQRPPAISSSLIEFVSEFEEFAGLQDKVTGEQEAYLRNFGTRAFNFGGLKESYGKHVSSFNKSENRSQKQQYLPASQELYTELEKLVPIGHTFIKQLWQIIDEKQGLAILAERSQKAQDYFEPKFLSFLRQIQKIRNTVAGQRGLKTYKEELEELEEEFKDQIRRMAKYSILVNESSKGKMPELETLRAWELKTKLNERPKVKKISTAEQSLALYHEGMSPKEIAQKRDLTEGTIFRHLGSFVEKGELEIKELIPKARIALILRTLRAHPGQKTSIIKSILGDEASFDEIRLVIAHEKAKKGE
ncbi:MAG: helix-turn-helix domain-containing protein [Bacteroidia bacterium]|nr:helix-turn-helix domain-containing protein [Bacteroidia bacterium]